MRRDASRITVEVEEGGATCAREGTGLAGKATYLGMVCTSKFTPTNKVAHGDAHPADAAFNHHSPPSHPCLPSHSFYSPFHSPSPAQDPPEPTPPPKMDPSSRARQGSCRVEGRTEGFQESSTEPDYSIDNSSIARDANGSLVY